MTTSPRTVDEPVLGAQTVVRALAVLGMVARAATDVGVSEISRALALHTSTVHRILRALVSEGYLSQNPETDRYRLGRESWLLGIAAERNLGFAAVAPVLERLRDSTGESANLVVRDGDQGLVVLRVESQQPLRFTQPIGARIPLYCTSTGKALLAFGTGYPADLTGLGELTAMTSTTITSRAALTRELEAVRARGWSTNHGERIEGVSGVAAPVLDPSTGEATAAVAVQGPAVRIPESRMADLAVLVVEAAAEIATLLPSGYRI
jgi:IclR family transcriptional regulator, acetate operon repressor